MYYIFFSTLVNFMFVLRIVKKLRLQWIQGICDISVQNLLLSTVEQQKSHDDFQKEL